MYVNLLPLLAMPCSHQFHLVHHLKDADNIIVLGNEGQIVEQGDPSKFEQGNKYARNSFVASGTTENPNEINDDAAETTESSTVPKQNYAEIDTQRDFLRRSGDTSLYTYYFKSIGWRHGLAMVFLNSTVVFFIYFPRKSNPLLSELLETVKLTFMA